MDEFPITSLYIVLPNWKASKVQPQARLLHVGRHTKKTRSPFFDVTSQNAWNRRTQHRCMTPVYPLSSC
eukprot:5379850-Amphidinium_carterae.3